MSETKKPIDWIALAFGEGIDARMDGLTVDANPYQDDRLRSGRLFKAWVRGWWECELWYAKWIPVKNGRYAWWFKPLPEVSYKTRWRAGSEEE